MPLPEQYATTKQILYTLLWTLWEKTAART